MKKYDRVIKNQYSTWTESEDYENESALENGIYDKGKNKIIELIGEEKYHDISDYFMYVACDAERIGFETGFQYGMTLMNEILNQSK